MNDVLELDPKALCVAVHTALEKPCPVCGAEVHACCIEDGEEVPVYAAHIGRATDGENLTVVHTGEYAEDGGAILRAIEH